MSFLDELNEISKTPEEAATEKYQDDYQYGMKFAEYDFMEVKSDMNKLLGGEGLFHTVITGPGRVVLQTMPISTIAQSIIPFIPTGK